MLFTTLFAIFEFDDLKIQIRSFFYFFFRCWKSKKNFFVFLKKRKKCVFRWGEICEIFVWNSNVFLDKIFVTKRRKNFPWNLKCVLYNILSVELDFEIWQKRVRKNGQKFLFVLGVLKISMKRNVIYNIFYQQEKEELFLDYWNFELWWSLH